MPTDHSPATPRQRLTSKEIDALLALIAIAHAGMENEGDYAGFDYPSMESAEEKLIVMAAKRKRGR